MRDDAELLRRYAEDRDETAFTELVQRHLGLVYHAALRQCGGDAHRAEDVAQTVFTDLARKAPELARRPVLAGWLYTSTRYAATQAVRTEVRRQAREQATHLMNELLPEGSSDLERAAEWEQLRPVIDDALHALGERDREAVLLRFFEGRAFAEVGARLAVSEDAARVRVDRALEKMRTLLERRGLHSTSGALAAVLAQQAGLAAPEGLVASIAGAVAVAAGATTLMSTTLWQIGLTVALVVAGGAGFLVQARTHDQLRTEIAALRDQESRVEQLRMENLGLARAATELAEFRNESGQLVRLREELAAQRQQRPSAEIVHAEATAASLPPLANPDERLTLRLPDADLDTTMSALKALTGWRVVRDPSVSGRVAINLRMDHPVTKAEVVERVRTALRDQAGIVLEQDANGAVVLKRAARR